MIKCVNITRKYAVGDGIFSAINGIDLHIEKGEFASFVGKSGSGKSTLLNLIGLIDSATAGEIFIDGASVSGLKNGEKASLRGSKIGYIFQSFYLEPSYKVFANVEIPLLISNASAVKRRARVLECLEKVDMLDKVNAAASTLSGGEMQRVCIARALANNPEIILADEPCGNLDSENTENVMRILRELNNEGKTILLVTHNREEAEFANRIITLKDGKICGDEHQ